MDGQSLTVRLEVKPLETDPTVYLFQLTLANSEGTWPLEPTTSREITWASIRMIRAMLSMLKVADLVDGCFELESKFLEVSDLASRASLSERRVIEVTVTLPEGKGADINRLTQSVQPPGGEGDDAGPEGSDVSMVDTRDTDEYGGKCMSAWKFVHLADGSLVELVDGKVLLIGGEVREPTDLDRRTGELELQIRRTEDTAMAGILRRLQHDQMHAAGVAAKGQRKGTKKPPAMRPFDVLFDNCPKNLYFWGDENRRFCALACAQSLFVVRWSWYPRSACFACQRARDDSACYNRPRGNVWGGRVL